MGEYAGGGDVSTVLYRPAKWAITATHQGVIMELKQPEIIQILRRRCNLNQGALGAAAFDTSYESGRTKIKNIELGRQAPTPDDLEKMAVVLGVPVSELDPGRNGVKPAAPSSAREAGVVLQRRVLEQLPGADAYIEMLNKAVRLDDRELIGHIADKLAGLFAGLANEILATSEASAQGG
jgi:transcriptional regulator with XRE-family HTH domain